MHPARYRRMRALMDALALEVPLFPLPTTAPQELYVIADIFPLAEIVVRLQIGMQVGVVFRPENYLRKFATP
jgi:hypothetical protein